MRNLTGALRKLSCSPPLLSFFANNFPASLTRSGYYKIIGRGESESELRIGSRRERWRLSGGQADKGVPTDVNLRGMGQPNITARAVTLTQSIHAAARRAAPRLATNAALPNITGKYPLIPLAV